jgi:hypothetical protein
MPTTLSTGIAGQGSRNEWPRGPQLLGVTPVAERWFPAVMTNDPGTAWSAQWNSAQPTINDGCRRPGAKETLSVAASGLLSMFVYGPVSASMSAAGEMSAVNLTPVVHCCAGLSGSSATE